MVFCYGSSSRLIHFLSAFQSTLYVHINPLLDLNCLCFLGKVNLIFWPITPCCMHECLVSLVMSDSATLWTIAHQAPLSKGFCRQEYWSGLPCPSSRDLPDPGIEPASPRCPAWAGGFFTTRDTWVGRFSVVDLTPSPLHSLIPYLVSNAMWQHTWKTRWGI